MREAKKEKIRFVCLKFNCEPVWWMTTFKPQIFFDNLNICTNGIYATNTMPLSKYTSDILMRKMQKKIGCFCIWISWIFKYWQNMFFKRNLLVYTTTTITTKNWWRWTSWNCLHCWQPLMLMNAWKIHTTAEKCDQEVFNISPNEFVYLQAKFIIFAQEFFYQFFVVFLQCKCNIFFLFTRLNVECTCQVEICKNVFSEIGI